MRLCDNVEFVREIRDPIHRYIKLTSIEDAIVDSPFFQRLANVSQMHSAYLVYPGGTYARKVHSFGAMHIAHRMITRILYQQAQSAIDAKSHPLIFVDNPKRRKNWKCDTNLPLREALASHGVTFTDNEQHLVPIYIIQAMRLAALLHDVGHGPYSHLFEAASVPPGTPRGKGPRYDHEEKSISIIKETLTTARPKGGKPYLDQVDADFVASILAATLHKDLRFLHDIISSPLDADKMDYLLRDSHYTGTQEYGTIDLDRILDALIVHDGRLRYVSEGLDALVQALNAMFFMYNNVYLHRTVRGFDLTVLDELSGIHDFLRGYQNTEPPARPGGSKARPFFDLDDATFLLELELCRLAEYKGGIEGGPFLHATVGMSKLRRREKRYKALVDTRLALPLAHSLNDAASKLADQLGKKVSEFATSVRVDPKGFRIDLEKSIRPIGLSLRDVEAFLNEEVIYDVQTGHLRSFGEYQPHYKSLTKIVLPVRVYIQRGLLADISPTARESFVQACMDVVADEQARQSRGT